MTVPTPHSHGLTDLAKRIAGQPKGTGPLQRPQPAQFTTGTVSALNSDGTVNVTVGGASPAVPASIGAGESPQVGDTVKVLVEDTQVWVLGVVGDAQNAGGWMPGDLKYTSASAAPPGWLVANGQAVSRTAYARLFAVLGTGYGGGDGSTTFNVPDLRDRIPIGAGLTYSLGERTGGATASLSSDNVPGHTHPASATVVDGGHAHASKGLGFVDSLFGGTIQGPASGSSGEIDEFTAAATTALSVSVTVENNSGGTAFSVLNPVFALTPLVKT